MNVAYSVYRRAALEDADAIAHVHCESWRTTYTGLIPQHVIESWADIGKRIDGWRAIVRERPETLWLAELNGNVVGFADGGKAREPNDGCDGQLFGIYLLASAQRRGIGRQLVAKVFADLQAKNYASARVEVLKGNAPAIAFYQLLGATFVREAPFEMMGESLTEWVYVWRVLPSLEASS
jgi:ribosomal protein S18 acetylase RimI-like enzyme